MAAYHKYASFLEIRKPYRELFETVKNKTFFDFIKLYALRNV